MSIVFEVEGLNGRAKVFSTGLDGNTISQIIAFMDCPASENAEVAIMPDAHAGAGSVIGMTSTYTDRIIPNIVGVDIGCGVLAIKLPQSVRMFDFDKLDKVIRKNIPSGFDVHQKVSSDDDLRMLADQNGVDIDPVTFKNEVNDVISRISVFQASKDGLKDNRTWRSIGTLGGGNHFIEIDRDPETAENWLVIHSGSRIFGLHIAVYHQKIANAKNGAMGGLAFLEGDQCKQYLRDMRIAQTYASINRKAIALNILAAYGRNSLNEFETIESVHNYIDLERMIIRKGAISAQAGEKVIIPLNMAEGCIVGVGLGNRDWNYSAPHGAGRRMSRTEAKQKIALETFRARMRKAKVWSSCISAKTLDEAPMAYKPSKAIYATIADTVNVEKTLKAVYNFKAT